MPNPALAPSTTLAPSATLPPASGATGNTFGDGLFGDSSFGGGVILVTGPSIGGVPVVGGQLTANAGTWAGSQPITYTFQWQRVTANISGATSSIYIPVAADIGSTLRVVVTATNAGGSGTATSASTAVVVAGGGVNHYAATPPTIVLEVDFPDNPLAVSYSQRMLSSNPYAWYRLKDASAVEGATMADSGGAARHGLYKVPGGSITLATGTPQPIPGDATSKIAGFTVGALAPYLAGVLLPGSSQGGDLSTGFSLAIWTYTGAGSSSENRVFDIVTDLGSSQNIRLIHGGNLVALVDPVATSASGGYGGFTTPPDVVAGARWDFLVLTWTPAGAETTGTWTIYVNGIKQAEAAGVTSNINMVRTFTVSSSVGDVAMAFQGYVAEPASWPRPLDKGEVLRLFTSAATPTTTYPLATWTAIPKVRGLSINRGRGAEQELSQPDAGAASFTVDDPARNLEPEYAAGSHYPNVIPQRAARATATLGGTPYTLFNAYAERWPVEWKTRQTSLTVPCYDALAAIAQWTIYQSRPYELSSVRINGILDRVGWPAAARDIQTGQEVLGPVTWDNTSALEALRAVATDELGLLFVDERGYFVFQDRDYRTRSPRSLAAQALFSEGPPGLPYTQLAVAEPDVQKVVNEVTVVPAPDPSGWLLPNGFAFDATSQAQYGQRTLERTTLLATQAQAQAQAAAIVARLKTPKLRFPSLTFEPARDPSGSLWRVALSLKISDRITISRSPAGGGATVSRNLYVEAVQHTVDDKSRWVTTLQLSPV